MPPSPSGHGGCPAARLGAAADPLNEPLVHAPAIMDLTILCTDRAGSEQPFTSASEQPFVLAGRHIF